MPDDKKTRETFSFGPFEWDPARAVLRRDGVRLRLTGELGRTYDVSRPDGLRFLAVKAALPGEEYAPRAEIVLDWFGELESRVPRPSV